MKVQGNYITATQSNGLPWSNFVSRWPGIMSHHYIRQPSHLELDKIVSQSITKTWLLFDTVVKIAQEMSEVLCTEFQM